MTVLIAPDKFKGSLNSFEVCEAIANGIRDYSKDIETILFPMADGGDGFADVLRHYLKTSTIECATVDPLLRPINANYLLDIARSVAIIETASASGLTLLKDAERNPLQTSTFGTGLMIQHAMQSGAKEIILGLGGTATNEAGTGILSALGFRFFDKDQHELKSNGQSLSLISSIELPASIPEIKFRLACDVTNPLYGKNGAAYTYAPQKGASPEDVEELDKGLAHFSELLSGITGKRIHEIPGTGAAGGIAAGLMSFFQVEILKGIELVIDASKLYNAIGHAGLVITGEGKMDDQTKAGKVAGTIAKMAAAYGVPCIAICGINELDQASANQLGLDAVYAISELAESPESSISRASQYLQMIATKIAGNHLH